MAKERNHCRQARRHAKPGAVERVQAQAVRPARPKRGCGPCRSFSQVRINHLDAAARVAGRSRSSTLRQILDREFIITADNPAPQPLQAETSTAPASLRKSPSARTVTKNRKSAVAKSPQVYHLKVTLLGVSPRIWRRLQVLGNTRLSELHNILQISMGWENYHLHRFDIGGAIAGNTPLMVGPNR